MILVHRAFPLGISGRDTLGADRIIVNRSARGTFRTPIRSCDCYVV